MVVVTVMAASGAMEGAGIDSVNAKRSSRYDAARETQSEWRDAENILATRHDKWLARRQQALRRSLACLRLRLNRSVNYACVRWAAACFCSRIHEPLRRAVRASSVDAAELARECSRVCNITYMCIRAWPHVAWRCNWWECIYVPEECRRISVHFFLFFPHTNEVSECACSFSRRPMWIRK